MIIFINLQQILYYLNYNTKTKGYKINLTKKHIFKGFRLGYLFFFFFNVFEIVFVFFFCYFILIFVFQKRFQTLRMKNYKI